MYFILLLSPLPTSGYGTLDFYKLKITSIRWESNPRTSGVESQQYYKLPHCGAAFHLYYGPFISN